MWSYQPLCPFMRLQTHDQWVLCFLSFRQAFLAPVNHHLQRLVWLTLCSSPLPVPCSHCLIVSIVLVANIFLDSWPLHVLCLLPKTLFNWLIPTLPSSVGWNITSSEMLFSSSWPDQNTEMKVESFVKDQGRNIRRLLSWNSFLTFVLFVF